MPFYVYKRLDKLWEQIWVLGNQNWDFGVKMEFFLRVVCLSSSWQVIGGHGELLSTTTYVFVVLGLCGRSGPF